MTKAGYYRQPTIRHEQLVFVAEDDLWTVEVGGGVARRLTANLGEVSRPCLSPDGQWLAFTGKEDGPTEIYVMPAAGGVAERRTYLGASTLAIGWSRDGQHILFNSNARHPFPKMHEPYRIPRTGGEPEPLPYGPCTWICERTGPAVVICRNGYDPARWKRYRGGTAGEIWIDRAGDGSFEKLMITATNPSRPMLIGDRIYFLDDQEGIGNLYSCTLEGDDLRRHTDHEEFYVRQPQSDGRRIVYHAGGDLFVFDPATDQTAPVEFDFPSPRVQQQRRFVAPGRFLEEYALHPQGHSVAIVTRGQLFAMGLWEGAAQPIGAAEGVRYRLAQWLPDGQRIVVSSDAGGEERLEIHSVDPLVPPVRYEELDLGRPIDIAVAPEADRLVVSNHRFELWHVDLVARAAQMIDRSHYERISGISWSGDGRFVAYSLRETQNTAAIRICQIDSGAVHRITEPVLYDVSPVFDPEGRYLYFLSYRQFDPVYDNLQFDLSFPRGVKPYLVTLRKDLPSPFVPLPRAPGEKSKGEPAEKGKGEGSGKGDSATKGNSDTKGENDPSAAKSSAANPAVTSAEQKTAEATSASGETTPGDKSAKSDAETPDPKHWRIDFDGIAERIVAVPVPDARYAQIDALKNKILFLSFPIEGKLSAGSSANGAANGVLEAYNLEELEKETLVGGVGGFTLSAQRKTLAYRSGQRIRVIKAGEKSDEGRGSDSPSRKNGWLDLRRLKVAVLPVAERRQMYRETWRLEREHFWADDMSQIDWQRIYERYLPLVERVSTRSEFSDLLWEVQGELGTSHAYEAGGDYRPEPRYDQGLLGADFAYDADRGGYRITSLVRGDAWEDGKDSPLCEPGLCVSVGDVILAINGRRLTDKFTPGQALVHQADSEVAITLAAAPTDPPSGAKCVGELSSPPAETASAASSPSDPTSPSDARLPSESNNPAPAPSTPPSAASSPQAKPLATRTITVRALRDDRAARYRQWVEGNRRRVHTLTGGRCGYLHIPDMGPRGFSEFHRYYLSEIERGGLVVDLRFNGGGHVSSLLLEKLARRPVGYCVPRYGRPHSYPDAAKGGPLVALTNEHAGSDGDIFSHCFKIYQLGPLVGKRTWGGVIGIWVRHWLVDGTVTTQPEFSFWFEDVGWNVENYGTDPDIPVEITPADYAAGHDPQLERGVALVIAAMETAPRVPSFDSRPSRALPKLPPRKRT